MTEREIRAVVAVRPGAVRQTPEGLRCLPVEPTPAERARVLNDEAWAATLRLAAVYRGRWGEG